MAPWAAILLTVILVPGLSWGFDINDETLWDFSSDLNVNYYNPVGRTRLQLSYNDYTYQTVWARMYHELRLYDVTIEPMIGLGETKSHGERSNAYEGGLKLHWKDLSAYARYTDDRTFYLSTYYKWLHFSYQEGPDYWRTQGSVRLSPFDPVTIYQGLSYDSRRELIISTHVHVSFDIGHVRRPEPLIEKVREIHWQ